MKVSGFTFIRNALKYDFPIREAIRSILPLCDEVVVAVGRSEDATLELIRGLDSPKIRIIETVWDERMNQHGAVLADETNKALAAVSPDSDWLVYIQGDEAMHEADLPEVRAAMERCLEHPEVDGLLFNYRHFFGSYDFVATARKWYRHEIRIVRNGIGVYSYRDAQGFRKGDNEKLRVKPIQAFIHHYGYVRPPRLMAEKHFALHQYYADESALPFPVADFDYGAIHRLDRFVGTHPAAMRDRISRTNWKFDFDPSCNQMSIKDRVKDLAQRWFGLELGYKNYIRS